MYEIFKTVLVLSAFGGALTLVLLLFKPLTAKKLPARWQYYIWLAVIFCMVFPAWKLIPKKNVPKIIPQNTQQTQITSENTDTADTQTVIVENTPFEYREVSMGSSKKVMLTDLIAYIWLAGLCVFIVLALCSYYTFLLKKRKCSVYAEDISMLCEVKKELGIKRKIRLRLSPDTNSPMLVGTFFPVIYLPCSEVEENSLRMIFRHELNHYKCGDLIYKWCCMIVNAVHWFNPLAYILSANVSEACEIACDMAVTKDMTEEEQKLYMKTILDMMKQ